MQRASRALFQQHIAEKESYRMGKPESKLRGYFAERSEWLDFEDKPADYKGDLKEGFDIGFSSAASTAFFGRNQWPSIIIQSSKNGKDISFREASERYINAVNAYCNRLMRVFAVGLGYPPDWFQDQTHDPLSTLRLLHYRPQPGTINGREVGCAPHSDYGTCTALLLDDVGGLEVLTPGGEWRSVPPMEGTYVTNIGDMLQKWSGGRWKSTIHRVMNVQGNDRYSIPYFFNPNGDAIIKDLKNRENGLERATHYDGLGVGGGNDTTCETLLSERYQKSKLSIEAKLEG